MTILRVKNWQKFQHYKDRNPPWIKLHFEMLSSVDWVMLDDASRVLAIVIMLVASKDEGRIPANEEYIKRVGHLNKTPNFKPLIDCGFLVVEGGLLADASAVQADARPEKEKYSKEKEKEKEGVKPQRLNDDKLKELPWPDNDPDNVNAYERAGSGFKLTKEWNCPDEWFAWVRAEFNWDETRTLLESEKFRDYWCSPDAKKPIKKDWFMTWKNWCRTTNGVRNYVGKA